MDILKKIKQIVADRKGKVKLAVLLGEIFLFVILVPVINSLVSGLVNDSTGIAATIYGLTDVILALGFFYVLYSQIKSP